MTHGIDKVYQNSISNELIASVFALILTVTSTFFVYDNQVEKDLVLTLWITYGLVLLSLFFHYFILHTFKNLKNYNTCLKLISPFVFWISIIYLPVIIILSFCFFILITLITKKRYHFVDLHLTDIFSYLYYIS